LDAAKGYCGTAYRHNPPALLVMKAILELLNDFPNKTVLVLGDVILDSYLEGSSTRLCREAPVPIVDFIRESRYPGGAGNTAVNVAAMGAYCLLFSAIGKDSEGCALLKHLDNKGVSTQRLLVVPERKTLFKQRIVANNQILARVDRGTTHAPIAAETELLANLLEECYKVANLDAIIVSDYGYGTVATTNSGKATRAKASFNYLLIIDAKDLTKYSELNATAMTPNYAEAMAILGEPILPAERGAENRYLPSDTACFIGSKSQIVVVTLESGWGCRV
jgi:D-beta-D-heptose 7-phosphate kinase/D-beta-D-heptose 1-phosphate adenosyltransferase